jgi:hypothetical protein
MINREAAAYWIPPLEPVIGLAEGETRWRGMTVLPIVPDGQITSCFPKCAVQPLLQKYFRSRLTQISSLIRAVLSQERGVAHVTNVGRDAVDAGAPKTMALSCVRPSRVVLTPRCWRQVCDKKRRRRCQTSVVTGESAK